MSIEKIQIELFLEMGKKIPVLDVRSPGEYDHAHIPGAYNLPLFSNEERKLVGTAYKQQSREAAIKIGLDFFGPKMRLMIEYVETLMQTASGTSKQVLIHCWRGGMRSAAIAWLLDMYGFKVYTLIGGYKIYRHWIIESFSLPVLLQVLGGYTGSGKTHVLGELKNNGVAVIDLEKLASHKGSAFGNIGMPPQPSQEMFENLLGHEIRKILSASQEQQLMPVWVEDESQRIGPVNIPIEFWKSMLQAPLYFLDVPFEERLKHIVNEYGDLDREKIANAIVRIRKRLGGLESKMALEHLVTGEVESCFRILLKYYDKLYRRALEKRDDLQMQMTSLDCETANALLNVEILKAKESYIK